MRMILKLLYRFFGALLLVSIVGSLLGCAAAAPAPLPAPTATAFALCEPSPVGMSKISFPEIQGTTSSDGEIWALLFFERAVANQELKIVWRVTGEGELLSVEASHQYRAVVWKRLSTTNVFGSS